MGAGVILAQSRDMYGQNLGNKTIAERRGEMRRLIGAAKMRVMSPKIAYDSYMSVHIPTIHEAELISFTYNYIASLYLERN